MANESSCAVVIDEIDRLCVTYDKAKEYISKISSNIEQQIDIWQYRRQIILDQLVQMKSSSSCDFLLPKTQRINELAIEAVEALCRVDLLFEQIHRIDPKSRILPTSTSFSTRTLDTNVPSSHIRQPTPLLAKQQQQQFIPNGKMPGQQPLPIPVIRSQQQASSGRSSTLLNQEKTSFKPVISQQSSLNMTDYTSRSTPAYSQNHSQHSTIEGLHLPRPVPSSYSTRTPQSDHVPLSFAAPSNHPMASHYQSRQQPYIKEKIKLQRIPPGTKWLKAKIDIIDTLSGFYVENLDPIISENFGQMQDQLHDHYDNLEKSHQLVLLQNIAIGDFGVAKYSVDNRWYRARSIMCEGHDLIKIVFVDFGNIEVKSIDDFYSLDKLFTDLPAQAIACSLSEAFPRSQNENEAIWPEETIRIFKEAVIDKDVEVRFANAEEGTEQWPLHFVRIIVNNQYVTSLPALQQRIELRPNRYIAEQMAPALSQQEYILFNVPISDDD